MNIRLLIFIFAIHCSVAANAQVNLDWVIRTEGSGAVSYSMLQDKDGNIYSTGTFVNTVDFDPSPSTFNMTFTGFQDLYISKNTGQGNLVWAKQIGSPPFGYVFPYEISCDENKNIYIIGNYNHDPDFDPGPGTFHCWNSINSYQAFICKLDSNGNFIWAKSFKNQSINANDFVNSIRLDKQGNCYVAGRFMGDIDLDPGLSTYMIHSGSEYRSFICKLDSMGNFIWAGDFEGGNNASVSMDIDLNNHIYVGGYFKGDVDFDPSASTNILTTPDSSFHNYVAKLDSAGQLIFAKSIGGQFNPNISFIHQLKTIVDYSNNVYIGSQFSGTQDFNPGTGTFNMSTQPNVQDIYVCKLDSNGNFLWAKKTRGTNSSFLVCGNIDIENNFYLGGMYFDTIDVDPSFSVYQFTSTDPYAQCFMLKLDSNGVFKWAYDWHGKMFMNDIFTNQSSSIFACGAFQDSIDIDPSANVYYITSLASADVQAYTFKLSPTNLNSSPYPAIENQIELFPNPSKNQFRIRSSRSLEHATLTVYNFLGQQVFKQKNINGFESLVQVDDLPLNQYLVEIENQHAIQRLRWLNQ